MSPILLSVVLFALLASASASNNTYTLMAHLSRQSATLAHGLELANRLGNLGGYGGVRRRVAFTAYSSSDAYYSSSSKVKFRNIVTNVGDAFSSSLGTFTAPVGGLYVFEWSIHTYSQSSHKNYPALYVGSSRKLVTRCYSYSSYYNSCSKTATLELERGDEVYIRSYSGSLYVDGFYSSFSGWLL